MNRKEANIVFLKTRAKLYIAGNWNSIGKDLKFYEKDSFLKTARIGLSKYSDEEFEIYLTALKNGVEFFKEELKKGKNNGKI